MDNAGNDTVINCVDNAGIDTVISYAGDAARTPASSDSSPGISRHLREGRKLRRLHQAGFASPQFNSGPIRGGVWRHYSHRACLFLPHRI